jgi:CrcB protein
VTGSPLAVALVGVGGALGATCRHALGIHLDGRGSITAVNALGSLALGGALAAPIGSAATALFAVGFCGAFTTFSSFAVETVSTAADGDALVAARFAAANLIAGLVAFFVGATAVAAAV